VDAAIAVGVFLTFHRVRDVVEGLFFRRWQKAEADLRKFVREAAFFGEAPALTRAFVQALSAQIVGEPGRDVRHLAGGAGVAAPLGEIDRRRRRFRIDGMRSK
jgi:hypothetical protein